MLGNNGYARMILVFCLAIFAIVILCGMNNSTVKETKVVSELVDPRNGITENMHYYKDKRTDLCYSVVEYGKPGYNTYSFSHALVPCSPEVMKLVLNK